MEQHPIKVQGKLPKTLMLMIGRYMTGEELLLKIARLNKQTR
jgi:hypothetical protein